MDEFLLIMTVLVCVSMIGVMTRLTFYDHRDGMYASEVDAIKKLLAQFDELEAQADPMLFAPLPCVEPTYRSLPSASQPVGLPGGRSRP